MTPKSFRIADIILSAVAECANGGADVRDALKYVVAVAEDEPDPNTSAAMYAVASALVGGAPFSQREANAILRKRRAG